MSEVGSQARVGFSKWPKRINDEMSTMTYADLMDFVGMGELAVA